VCSLARCSVVMERSWWGSGGADAGADVSGDGVSG
jgi:hypothetical protein